jgi:sec-independent protein translocase protein TatA
MAITPVLGFLEGPDLLIVLAVVLVLFGGSRLPQLARSLGQAKKEFQAGIEDDASSATETPAASKDETVNISAAELERLRKAAGETKNNRLN